MWLKAFHLIFMVAWFAGLFYLPRLFVYHAMSQDVISLERFKLMERKLYLGIMTPAMILTLFFGLWMLVNYAWDTYRTSGWLYVKLFLIVCLIAFHLMCGKWLLDFSNDRNLHSDLFYRWVNEVPLLFLASIVILASVKPF
jgi:putative membrane protein